MVMRMKKSKFIKSTVILLIGGFFTKLLGMVIRIILTRCLGSEGMGIYMMIMPTFNLLIALAQFGFPVAISKLVAEDKSNNKNLVFSVIPIAFLMNVILFFFLFFGSDFLANHLLQEERTYYGLIAIGFVLPFISLSSILRGYFFGKEKMFPHIFSNIIEDITRLFLLGIGIPYFLKVGVSQAICFVILTNIVSEVTSILVLFFFLPKNFKISKKDFLPTFENMKKVLKISLPTTASRIIGSIGYFFEPVILTYVLLKVGYSNHFIVNEYGILNGYVMPLLLLPSFFTNAISQALIPTISYAYSHGYGKYAKKKIIQAIGFSLMIGIPVTIVFMFIPEVFLRLIYNTNQGIPYIRFLAPICLFHYIQSPIASSLQAMGYAKSAMKGTFFSTIIRLGGIYIFSSLQIGIWGLILSTSINILFVTFYDLYYVKKALKNKE